MDRAGHRIQGLEGHNNAPEKVDWVVDPGFAEWDPPATSRWWQMSPSGFTEGRLRLKVFLGTLGPSSGCGLQHGLLQWNYLKSWHVFLRGEICLHRNICQGRVVTL